MADIFISYASDDRAIVEPLAKALENQGWSIFWDRTIPVRKSWRDLIQSELEDSKCVVVIWTENSVNSKWVLAEVSEGYEKDNLTQVLFENIAIPFPYKQEQAADLTDWKAEPTHSGFTILLSAISEVVGPSPLKVKEAEQKRAEEERRHKQEEERQRSEEEQEREKSIRKADENRKHREAEANRRTENERKRKAKEKKSEKAEEPLKKILEQPHIKTKENDNAIQVSTNQKKQKTLTNKDIFVGGFIGLIIACLQLSATHGWMLLRVGEISLTSIILTVFIYLIAGLFLSYLSRIDIKASTTFISIGFFVGYIIAIFFIGGFYFYLFLPLAFAFVGGVVIWEVRKKMRDGA